MYLPWYDVAMSSTGQYQVAALLPTRNSVGAAQLYLSSDFGSTWNKNTISTQDSSGTYCIVAISSSGQYQAAAIHGGFIYESRSYALSWSVISFFPQKLSWSYIAISDSGLVQAACIDGGFVYVSSDFGVTWTTRGSSNFWTSISISSSGQVQVASVYQGFIYISYDYGATFAVSASSQTWQAVDISSNGIYVTAISVPGFIYIGNDYDLSIQPISVPTLSPTSSMPTASLSIIWTQVSTSRKTWEGIDLSADGRYQSACAFGDYIYVSSDYGVIFQAKGIAFNWEDIAISSTGQYQTSVPNYGPIYISNDFGITWSSSTSPVLIWQTVAMSADGFYQSAAVASGNVYISRDLGVSWSVINSLPSTTW